MGAYMGLVTPGVPILGAFMYNAIYKFPAYHWSVQNLYTNKTWVDAYRGAGRPEATYAIEREFDDVAVYALGGGQRSAGVDGDELGLGEAADREAAGGRSRDRAGLFVSDRLGHRSGWLLLFFLLLGERGRRTHQAHDEKSC